MKVYYIRHDFEIPGYDQSRGSKSWPPETVPIFFQAPGKKSVSKLTINLSRPWQRAVELIQNPKTRNPMGFLKSPGMGWVNPPQKYPRVQSLAFGGNFVQGEEYNKDYVIIDTFNISENPPEDLSFQTISKYSCFVHRFIVVNVRRRMTRDAKPGGVFILLVSPAGKMLIPKWRVLDYD